MINDNHIDVAKYRGPIRVCEHCGNSKLPPPLKTYCKFCLVSGYIAQCLKCDGEGMVGSVAPWDGKSEYKSVCDICGGTGSLSAKEPESPRIQLQPEQPQGVQPQPQLATQTQQNQAKNDQKEEIKKEAVVA